MVETFVPAEKLENGRVYKIKSRNLLVGVWNAETGGFIGIREKFGDRYLFTEYLWTDFSGTARAIAPTELTAGTIPLKESLGSFCQTCDEPVESVWAWNEEKQRDLCTGNRHLEPTDCEAEGTYCAYMKMNRPLFDLMDDLDKKLAAERAEEWTTPLTSEG